MSDTHNPNAHDDPQGSTDGTMETLELNNNEDELPEQVASVDNAGMEQDVLQKPQYDGTNDGTNDGITSEQFNGTQNMPFVAPDADDLHASVHYQLAMAEEDEAMDSWEDPCPERSIESIEDELLNVFRDRQDLQFETGMFDDFRLDLETELTSQRMSLGETQRPVSRDGQKLSAATEATSLMAKGSSKRSSGRLSRRSKNKSSEGDRKESKVLLQLSLKDKLDIAIRKAYRAEKALESQKATYAKREDEEIAVIKESELSEQFFDGRYAKLKRAYSERQVGHNHRSFHLSALERFVVPLEYFFKFNDDDLLVVEGLYNKFTMLAARERANLQAREAQMARYTVGGDAELSKLDYDHLFVQTETIKQQLLEMHNASAKLKLRAGDAVRALTTCVNGLSHAEEQHKTICRELNHRKKFLAKLTKERMNIEASIKSARIQNAEYKELVTKYRAPDVVSYVRDKEALDQKRKTKQTLEKRMELAQSEHTVFSKWWTFVEKHGTGVVDGNTGSASPRPGPREIRDVNVAPSVHVNEHR